MDCNRAILRQDARDVVGETAAGDVGGRLQELRIVKGDKRLQIRLVYSQQLFADGDVQFRNRIAGLMTGHFEEEFASEGIAVGVQAVGGQSEQYIAGDDIGAGEHAFAFDGSDDKASQIVFAFGVKAGHFGGFATDQRTAVLFAAASDAGDDAAADRRVQFADGEIIEKE